MKFVLVCHRDNRTKLHGLIINQLSLFYISLKTVIKKIEDKAIFPSNTLN